MMQKLKNLNIPLLPVYPILFALYPVLFLWNANRAQEPAYVVLPPLLITLAGLLVVYLITFALVRNIHRAALLTTVLSFYLLTFGHLYNLAGNWNNGRIQPYLLPVTGLLIAALLIYLAVKHMGSPSLSKALNLISVILVAFQVISAMPYYLSIAKLQTVSAHAEPIPVTGGPQRDVYFILLDNYGRQDILQQGSNFDNSELVNALKQRGFVLPDCAQGNYISTAPVMTSILNMNYLDPLGVPEKAYTERGGYEKMAPLILDNEVIRKFRSYGYHIVTFRGFMGLIDIQNSDTYISFDKDKALNERLETQKFQDLYFGTTLFSPLSKQLKLDPGVIQRIIPLSAQEPTSEADQPESKLDPQFQAVYRQNIYAFDALQRIPKEIQSPKFVYAHMYAAHWPFMMRPDGSLRLPFTQELTVDGYVDGIRYTNNRILAAIDSILANSKVKPVIILQGDHSDEWVKPVEWSGKDRLKILSAYYLPDGGDQMLYPTISPVNNFRLVFQRYFGENIPLLPDVYHYLNPDTKKMDIAPKTCMSGVNP